MEQNQEQTQLGMEESQEQTSSQESSEAVETKEEVKYELAVPTDCKVAKERVDEIVAYAREQGLSPDVAQRMLENEHKAVVGLMEKAQQELSSLRQQWVDGLKNDKAWGGDNYARTVALATRTFNKYATPELKELLNKTGYGDQKDLVITFARIGADMADDTLINSRSSGGAPRELSIEERMYAGHKE